MTGPAHPDDVLAALRADPAAYDLGDRTWRHAAITGLLADRRDGDHALVRALLAAEVAAHAAGEHREGDDAWLRRAGYLLALFRDPEDVWRQWRAKTATADAFVTYPVAALAAAGLELTLAWLDASAHPRRDDVRAMLEAVDAAELAAWWTAMRDAHGAPDAPA